MFLNHKENVHILRIAHFEKCAKRVMHVFDAAQFLRMFILRQGPFIYFEPPMFSKKILK